ncbi:addiction module toxin RelE [Paradesulfitobacterium aromaticivorans]
MRARGLLPPVKPKLNRGKFAKEVLAEFENFSGYSDIMHLYHALGFMRPSFEIKEKISLEQMGVLKLLKISMEIKKFIEEKRNNGESEYKVMDLYEKAVKPTLDL